MPDDDRQNPSKTEEGAVPHSGNGTAPSSPPEDSQDTTWTEPSYTETGEVTGSDSSTAEQESYADPYTGVRYEADVATTTTPPAAPPPAPPASPEGDSDGDGDDEGMLRMSFLEHLEELRTRILHALAGLVVAYVLSLTFSLRLWEIVQRPAAAALATLGYTQKKLAFTSPMEPFSIIWIKLPLLVAIFLASPWILYQVWSFVSPGLYKRERRYAAPFIFASAGLFICGGLFAYFVAFRFGLTFLLGVGQGYAEPMVTMGHYFDIFVNIILGVGVVFELPVLIFFLTLLRVTTPGFLIRNTRYAVLAIVALAAVITPTPDIFNLMIFSVPMVLLFFLGVFASYLLVLSREGKRLPWRTIVLVLLGMVVIAGATLALAIYRFGYNISSTWPYLVK